LRAAAEKTPKSPKQTTAKNAELVEVAETTANPKAPPPNSPPR